MHNCKLSTGVETAASVVTKAFVRTSAPSDTVVNYVEAEGPLGFWF